MGKIEIVSARQTHIGPIAARIREIDRLECEIAGGTPKDMMRVGLMNGEVAFTALVDGRPEAMFGVIPTCMVEGRGRVWMLMTDDAMTHRRAILRFGVIYTAALHRYYAVLENHVHARNDAAIRWLSRLGYAVGPVDVVKGHPMRYFVRHR